MPRASLQKMTFLGFGVLAVLLLAGLPGLGQGVTDPSGELATAECYGHHKAEGFRSMDLFPEVIEEVPAGQPFEFKLTIRNPWLHELQNLKGYVNISAASGLSFPGEREPVSEAVNATIPGNPTTYATISHDIPVEVNATEIVVRVVGRETETPVPLPTQKAQGIKNDYDLRLLGPAGELVATGPDPTGEATPTPDYQAPVSVVEEVRANQTTIADLGTGQWSVELAYRGTDTEAPYLLEWTVYYNLSKSTFLIIPGPEKLGPNEQHTFAFTILAKDADELQYLRYGGIGTAFNEHTDKNIGDYGDYDKWNTMAFETGSELRVQGIQIDGGGVSLLEPVFRRWAQVLGFAGSFLIIPSLVFGGTFGRGSVNVLNKAFGGPRRRVLFHNSMSFWLLGVSLLHMVIFLYESFWNWSHGLVWGGLSLACMIGLGVTGATQRGFVAKWGFNRWRFVHFAMGILVFVFVLVHLLVDGSHLAPVREMLFGPMPVR